MKSKDVSLKEINSKNNSNQNLLISFEEKNSKINVEVKLEMKYFYKYFKFNLRQDYMVGGIINIIAKYLRLDLSKINFYFLHQN